MNQYNDLRIMDRSTLAAAQDAFLRSGGQIDVLQTFKFKPLPPRIEPQLTQEEIELRALADQIRTLSATMSKTAIAKQMGMSHERITRICKLSGINLPSGAGLHPGSRNTNPVEDKKLADRIDALARIGLGKKQAQKHIGISWHKMDRLVNAYRIAFPGPPRCD